MTFEQYWARLVAANPNLIFEESKMTLNIVTFKAQIKKAFEAGRNRERSIHDVLGDIFGNNLFKGNDQ
jgi:hypothetical protein